MNICTFRIGDMICGVAAEQVREVARVWRLTPVPCAPPQVAGVLNLRGQVLCAVECSSRLGQERSDTFALIVAHHGRAVALLADSIIDISATAQEMQPAPAVTGAPIVGLISGLLDTDRGVVHVLDLDEVIGR